MGFTVAVREASAGGRTGPVYTLADDANRCRAEVWPTWGFNCLRWEVGGHPILYTTPDWETNPVPTRSGHPILFPFPGRLRDGKLTAGGRDYHLPRNESSGKHAIHGFTPRTPWTVLGHQATTDSASVVGEFVLSRELPAARSQWPADFRLQVTYHLAADALTITATVENLGSGPLPWGLGYHGYFTLPGVSTAEDLILQTWANGLWEADAENLPTGQVLPVSTAVDFRQSKSIGSTHLDHVLTSLTGGTQIARLETGTPGGPSLTVTASPEFRELVLFTPQHRKAVAIEPYTCSADAANLAARGIDSGWQELPPGGTWTGTVAYTVSGL